MGGLSRAVEIAAEKAGLEHYRIVELPKLKDPLEQIISELSGETSLKRLQEELGPAYRYYHHLKNVLNARGMMARLPFEFEIY
jgi:protease-4